MGRGRPQSSVWQRTALLVRPNDALTLTLLLMMAFSGKCYNSKSCKRPQSSYHFALALTLARTRTRTRSVVVLFPHRRSVSRHTLAHHEATPEHASELPQVSTKASTLFDRQLPPTSTLITLFLPVAYRLSLASILRVMLFQPPRSSIQLPVSVSWRT